MTRTLNRTRSSRSASIVVAAGAALTVAMVPMVAAAATPPPEVQDAPAVRSGVGAVAAAEALAAGESGASYISGELVDELGYTPQVEDGLAMNPQGDCSSPVTLPASFEPACRTHDLGYDLLRVADRTGEHIPSELRSHLDRQMADRMRASCDTAGCKAMSVAAHVGVGLNTTRQGNGAPVSEPWLEWLPW
ncbi:MAG TPA: hypothetical protein H9870_02170 [Candidatus Corynebacterium avicola]|uniref:Uncharacterized protein n=1 Tax=Candidatus Corynebacterium avicola TaxID=2838527 RepID=A0A9D1RN58_9CORY|nr:hypothetical protein [Candidatus Corynebacterium avicola]